jgi:hypothetical protein
MAQISKGDTFVDGQQVTGARLNQLVDSASLVAGAITDQPNLTARTLQANDSLLVVNGGLLKEARMTDILGSSLPVIASSISGASVTTPILNGNTNNDVVVTPFDGLNVTGKTFTTADGILVTVTSVAHGLVSNQVVAITASVPAYSGTYRILVTTVDSFTYNIFPTASIASGTCTYIRKASGVVQGNASVGQNQYVNGSSTVVGSSLVRGNSTTVGTQDVTGQATFNIAPRLKTTPINPRLDYFVQTRAITSYASGWGGLQNLANIYGTKLTLVDITFTPQKAGNRVVLNWSLFGEGYNSASDIVFLVTRTPNSGVGAGVPVALPDAVDAQNNTWSGVTSGGHDANDATTPSTVTVKIIDFNTLDVSCTYSVHMRAANNRTATWFFNRPVNTAVGALDHEIGVSLGHAQEIYT